MRRPLLPALLLPLLVLSSCGGSPKTPQASTLSILDFGAKPGELCTAAIQAALDECSSKGGGTVSVPAGEYLSSTFHLRDGVTLLLEEGSVIRGVDDPAAYAHFVPEHDLTKYDSGGGTANSNCVSDPQWMKALVIGSGIRGAAIRGKGTIDGAHVFNPLGEEAMRGPHTIVVAEAEDFRLEGITITRAANYAFLGYALQRPVFEGVTITEGWDGIHVRGAKDAVIRGCRFETGDDCIAGGYWEDMVIQDCDINSSCNGIRMIMPSDGVDIRSCRFHGPGRYPHRTSGEARRCNMLFGVSLEPGAWGAASGTMRGIHLRDLEMENVQAPVATSVREGSVAEDLHLENVHARGVYGASIPVVSWNDLGFRETTIKDCSVSK